MFIGLMAVVEVKASKASGVVYKVVARIRETLDCFFREVCYPLAFSTELEANLFLESFRRAEDNYLMCSSWH